MIEKGLLTDLDELEALYNDLNDYFIEHTNYPGWIKHIYPIRDTAQKGIEANELYVLRKNGEIVGSVILSHEPEKAYDQVTWSSSLDYQHLIVVRILVVHPNFLNQGIAWELMKFVEQYGLANHIKAIRLDVSIHNLPAIGLYKKLGYEHRGAVDLGLGYDHLIWFDLYELLLA